MPPAKTKSDSPDRKKIEELFTRAEALFEQVVRSAFLHHKHLPSPDDVARLRQRLGFRLVDRNFRRLRSYDERAQLQTWLQHVTNNLALRFLRERARDAALEDVPLALFIQPATQEGALLLQERRALLAQALTNFKPQDRQIYALMWQGDKPSEIAEVLGIPDAATVYRQQEAIIRKLKRLVGGAKK